MVLSVPMFVILIGSVSQGPDFQLFQESFHFLIKVLPAC